ncbi:hypothetical protein SLEP1_g30287 [Rubroshorea leprosula]|uniref:Uncharacterized protein n=1 Tax=Rubroshorea leprosula TaxID=152421 RepID=A0AAV5JZM9_9ROSI|nr:hypothetical protein SLEP1_g30287 [Rubroshorea leprosula]
MLQENHSIFLRNPFLKKIIQLANLPHIGLPILGISFSSLVDLVVLIGVTPKSHGGYTDNYFDYIFLEEGQWHGLYFRSFLPLSGCNNLTFYDVAFCTFDWHRRLFLLKKLDSSFLRKQKCLALLTKRIW